MEKTAILIDGSFFIKRYRTLTPGWRQKTPKQVARSMYGAMLYHLRKCHRTRKHLYRIFYYDCYPLTLNKQNPISGNTEKLANSWEAVFRKEYYQELRSVRKLALRLGELNDKYGRWEIADPKKHSKLLKGQITRDDLTKDDVYFRAKQVGIDMRIGVDIASLAYKQMVDQIILVAGDADFVPASKLARREGIDFILDPMWNPIQPDLHEHIDGLQTTWRRN